ncbi:MAG: SDR family oxidoreductase [Chromatiales bacterium]|nr:SDR family oxidoreductase [Chromatiales bacterium]
MPSSLITGANRGIGLELVRHYRERGWDVTAWCRHAGRELPATGATVVEGVDVTDRDSLAAAAARSDEPLDLLVANAGVLEDESLEQLYEPEASERIRHQFAVNALGPVLTVALLAGRLRDGARVALITSRMGSIADNSSGGRYGYRMSKAALNAAGRSLAHDLSPRGISVGILHPGHVRTQMTGHSGNLEAAEAAAHLVARIDELDAACSGVFRHANGESLPW